MERKLSLGMIEEFNADVNRSLTDNEFRMNNVKKPSGIFSVKRGPEL